jgi:hypothetical protein
MLWTVVHSKGFHNVSDPRPTTIERAYAIAKSGMVTTAAEIVSMLAREGYPDGRAQLSGPAIRKRLRELCIASRK